MLSYIILTSIFFILIFERNIRIWMFKRKHKIPHGPTYFPVIGPPELIPLLGMRNTETCRYFKAKYGKFASFFAGSHFTFLMNDYDLIKEVISSESYEGRLPKHSITYENFISGKNLGILFSTDEVGLKMRKFSLSILRRLKFGYKDKMTEILQREMSELTKALDEHCHLNKNQVPIFDFIKWSVFGGVWTFLAGDSFPVCKKDLIEVTEAAMIEDEYAGLGTSPEWYTPFLRHFPSISNFWKLDKSNKIIKSFFRRVVREKKEIGAFRDDPNDYIDHFIKAIEENPSEIIHLEQLDVMLNEFILGGVVTTTNSIFWALYHIMKTPRVYSRLIEEIDEVVGPSMPNIEEDHQNMPYLEACINEVFRLENVVPVVSRTSQNPTELAGYHVPPHTMMIIDIDAPNKCPKLWGENAHIFYPERFLDEDMNIKKFDHFIPFGIGRRSCIGERTARITMFYHIINFFQNFDFLAPNDVKRAGGISNNIVPMDFQIMPRKRTKLPTTPRQICVFEKIDTKKDAKKDNGKNLKKILQYESKNNLKQIRIRSL